MIYSHRHDLTTGLPTVNVERKYTTNELTNYNDFVNGNYYKFSAKLLSSQVVNDLISWKSDMVDDGYVYTSTLNVSNIDFCGYSSNNVLNPSQSYFIYENMDYTLFYYNSFSLTRFYMSYNDDSIYAVRLNGLNSSSPYLYEYYNNVFNIPNSITLNTYESRRFLAIDISIIFKLDLYTTPVQDFITRMNTYISNGYISGLTIDENPILSADIDYADSTVTNVFMNNFSNTVNTYLNFGNVFNLNGMWNWININIFGGTANAFVYALWNIIVYEFVMDLLFLFYMFFMFLIDFTENLLEKPFDKINRG